MALAALLWMLSPPHPEQATLGYWSSTFALQMVRDWPTLTIVLATPAREGYRLHTLVDFAFILSYGALWIAMAFRFADRAWLKWIVSAFVLAAVFSDINENLAILRVLGVERGYTDGMALAIRGWAMWKWLWLMFGWFGLSIALLSHRLVPIAIGYIFSAGIVATAWFTSAAMLQLAMPAFGITLAVQAFYFSRYSGTARA
jgi:hypothetical protein